MKTITKIISSITLIIICIILTAFIAYADEEITENQYEVGSDVTAIEDVLIVLEEETDEYVEEIDEINTDELFEDTSGESPDNTSDKNDSEIIDGNNTDTTETIENDEENEQGESEVEHTHTCIKIDAIAPTCTADGTIEYWKCEECGECFSDETATAVISIENITLPATGHSWNTGIVTQQPTCQVIGHKTFTCSVCGEERSETILKQSHVIRNGVCTMCGGGEGISKGDDGNWYYTVGGRVAAQYTGIKSNANGWWRIVNGKVDFNCDSVVQNENGWWYVKNGKVQFGYTGIKSNENGWWRIVNGKVDFNCDSVVQNENGWWYVKNGKVQFDYTGIKPNENGWWRIVNGKVDFNCDSVVQNENGWWYVKNGKVQFDYTGIRPNAYGWWRIVNGKVDFNCNSIEKNEYGWWYCKDGKVRFDFFGLAENRNGWWYVNGGKVDFSVNGLAANRNGTWLIYDGKVVFGKNGVVKGGDGNWYYVKNSKVMPLTGFFANENGTWYVVGGKVNFSYTGTATCGLTWGSVVNGKVKSMGLINNNGSSLQNMVIFGDSVAEGLGMNKNPQLRHTTLMANSLNLNEFNYSKSGAGYLYESRGDTLPTYLDELERLALNSMTRKQINNTQVVFIEGGINDYFMYDKWNSRSDANEYYINSVVSFVNKVKNAFSNAKVYFAYGERSSLAWLEYNQNWNQDYMEMINNIYQRVAEIPNVYLINGENGDAYYYYNILDQNDKYYLDGVHPNTAGHRIMADKLLTAVEK